MSRAEQEQGDAATNLVLAEESAKQALENERKAKAAAAALEKQLHELEEQVRVVHWLRAI